MPDPTTTPPPTNPDAPPAPHAEPADASPPEPGDLHAALAEARKELDSLRDALDAAHRRALIERALLEADAIDLETASLLAEAALSAAETPAATPETAVVNVVSDLKRRKPFLFARRSPRSTTLAPHAPTDPLSISRAHAAATGDRASLLRYLRLRRSA